MLKDGWQLDENSGVPLHTQLEQRLLAAIEGENLRAGDKIPSERELMGAANVSRATVRHAINSLVHQNVLERIQGRGTFVRQMKFETSLQIVYSFAEQLRAAGMQLKDKVLENELIPASPLLAHKLNIQPGDKLISLQRLRFVDGEPIMVNVAYMPYELCPGLLLETFESVSLYRTMSEKFGLSVVSATDLLESRPVDSVIARHLNIPVGTPIMYVKRMAFTEDHVPIHIGYNYIRGDMIRFRSEMHTQPALIELKRTTTGPDW